MSALPAHEWSVTPREARRLQDELRGRVVAHDNFRPVRCVAGIDVGFEENGAVTRAAVVVLDFPGLVPVERAAACVSTTFPYVPGLLSFREVPAILAALARLETMPDLLLCDGQGTAHPRRFGIACHVGVLTGLPSIGVAKSRLVGEHAAAPCRKGQWVPLTDGGETIGAVLCTRAGVKPLFVSVGHRICLESAVEMVLACTTKYRLPETTRLAHALASHPGR